MIPLGEVASAAHVEKYKENTKRYRERQKQKCKSNHPGYSISGIDQDKLNDDDALRAAIREDIRHLHHQTTASRPNIGTTNSVITNLTTERHYRIVAEAARTIPDCRFLILSKPGEPLRYDIQRVGAPLPEFKVSQADTLELPKGHALKRFEGRYAWIAGKYTASTESWRRPYQEMRDDPFLEIRRLHLSRAQPGLRDPLVVYGFEKHVKGGPEPKREARFELYPDRLNEKPTFRIKEKYCYAGNLTGRKEITHEQFVRGGKVTDRTTYIQRLWSSGPEREKAVDETTMALSEDGKHVRITYSYKIYERAKWPCRGDWRLNSTVCEWTTDYRRISD